jgi:Acyclic terpene utilisation family protein AtuA
MTDLSRSRRTSILVPVGALGAGISAGLVDRAIASGVDAIACDAGSTDSGPSYLFRAVSKVSRQAVKRDLEVILRASQAAKIPLLIGSCGTSGADAGVDWTADIVVEIAREHGLEPRVALLYSEQDARALKRKNAVGAIRPLPPAGPVSEEAIDACAHIVALMGPEPYIRALSEGADVVLGGRTTDTAVIAAVALMRGANAAAAWHGAKVTECGGLCAVGGGPVILHVDETGFEVEPVDPASRCTPESVSAHMLYENSDPFLLTEPGGVLDVSEADYEALDDRVTRVTGMTWSPKPYTMKLEGASGGPFQTIMFIGIEDPFVLNSLNLFETRLLRRLRDRAERTVGAGDWDISLRIYGWNGISGQPRPDDAPTPLEVGVMFVATAPTQEMATLIAKTCNPSFFHFPLEPGIEMPSYAYPFTPAEIERGQVFEFRLCHVVEAADGFELVRTRTFDLSRTEALEHA